MPAFTPSAGSSDAMTDASWRGMRSPEAVLTIAGGGIWARRAAGGLFWLEQVLQLRLNLLGKGNCPIVLEPDPGRHELFFGS